MKYLIDKPQEKLCIDLSEVAGISPIKIKNEKDGTWYHYFEIAFKNKAALMCIVVMCVDAHSHYHQLINEQDYNELISKFASI